MTKVLLGDVAEEVKEKYQPSNCSPIVVGLENLVPGEIRLKNWNSDNAKNITFTKAFHKGQILFGRRRAYLKKACVAPSDGICSGDITVISAKPGKILPELLPFVIQNDGFFEYAVEKSAGSLSPRVKWSQLKEYEFQLPEINEQHKLVEVLWQLVDTKEAYKNLLAQTDELVKSQFIEMFGDPITNSAGRPTVKFENIMKLQRGFDLPEKNRDQSGKVPVYGANGLVGYHSEAMAHDGVITGRSGTIGQVYCVYGDYWPLNTALFSVDTHGNNITYLAYLLRYFDVTRFNTGTGVPTLNRNEVHKQMVIDVPLKEQENFAAIVEQSDKSKFTMLN